MAKFKKGFPMRKRSLLVVLIALAVVITAQPVLAGQSHWVKVVNILLEKQKWIGQGQELYSYTMHDAEKWSTATWTYNHTTGMLMLSISQSVKVEESKAGKIPVVYKQATVHIVDADGDCKPEFGIFSDFVITAKGSTQTFLNVPPVIITSGHKISWNMWYAKLLKEHQIEIRTKKKTKS